MHFYNVSALQLFAKNCRYWQCAYIVLSLNQFPSAPAAPLLMAAIVHQYSLVFIRGLESSHMGGGVIHVMVGFIQELGGLSTLLGGNATVARGGGGVPPVWVAGLSATTCGWSNNSI